MKQYVLITGSSQGIGKAIAGEYAKRGAELLLVARNEEALKLLAQDLEGIHGNKNHTLKADLSTIEGCQSVVNWIEKNNWPITHLINNAGYGAYGDFPKQTKELLENIVDLNIKSILRLTHGILPFMEKSGGGKIMNVASTAAFYPGPFMAVYYATKAFVLSLSEGLAIELREKNIQVSVLCPGPTISKFWQVEGLSDDVLKRFFWRMTAESVGTIAYQQFEKNRCVIVPGITNYLLTIVPKFSPRFLVREIMYKIHRL